LPACAAPAQKSAIAPHADKTHRRIIAGYLAPVPRHITRPVTFDNRPLHHKVFPGCAFCYPFIERAFWRLIMKRESIELHGVKISLTGDGGVEASIGGLTTAKSDSVDSLLLYFVLREIQALNGNLRGDRPKGSFGSEGIFPP